MIAPTMTTAAVVFSMVLGALSGLSPSAAQEAVIDVAYVDTVSGRVVAFTRGALSLAGPLDAVSQGTRFDLQANSELRLCHYGVRRFLTVKGPARATVLADGLTVEAGKAAEISHETCAVAQVSKFQGGFLARGVSFKQ
jgi:hypothetical protein